MKKHITEADVDAAVARGFGTGTAAPPSAEETAADTAIREAFAARPVTNTNTGVGEDAANAAIARAFDATRPLHESNTRSGEAHRSEPVRSSSTNVGLPTEVLADPQLLEVYERRERRRQRDRQTRQRRSRSAGARTAEHQVVEVRETGPLRVTR